MRLISPLLDAEVAGTTSGDLLEVNAWRGGALLERALAVTGWSLSWDATRQVQGQGTFTVADPDGRLAPWGLADALGPGGSRLQVTWVSGLSGIRVPLGWWRIRKADPAETWRLIPTSTPSATIGPVAHTNLATNPDQETAGAVATLRVNLAFDPAATANATTAGQARWAPRWFGSGGAGATTLVTGAGDGPVPGLTTYQRKTWTTAPVSNGDTGFLHCAPGNTTTVDATGGMAVTAGTVYTFSSYVRSSAAGKTGALTVYWRDAAGAYLSSNGTATTTLPTGTWHRFALTATAPAGATRASVVSDVDGGTLWAAGNTLDGTGLLIESVAALALPYFDGSTAAAGDFTHAWVGTANSSTSTERAPAIVAAAAYNGNLATRWSSTVEHDTGARSLACMPVQTANPVGFYWLVTPALAGQVITAKLRVKVPLGQVVHVSARTSGGSAQGTVIVTGTGAWQDVTMSTTSATDGALIGVQVYNATPRVAGPAGTFYVDRLLIVVGATAYTGPWFSGATPDTSLMTYAWTGAADASTSTASPTLVTYASRVVRVSGGGSVQVQADEETATVALNRLDAEVVGAATCLAEIRRLLADIGPVTVLGGVVDGPVPAGLVYGDSRSDAVDDLLTSVLAVMRMGADGSFEVVPARGLGPVWTLAGGDDGVLVNTVRSLSDEGVYNAATSTGETATGQPLVGRAQRQGGPLVWGGPYGKVPVFHRAVAQDVPGVQADAQTVLATLSAAGEVDLAVTCLAHPGVQPNDRVTVLAPTRAGDAPLEGRVVGMTLASAGSTSGTTPAKSMSLTVRVPAEALEAVARRVARTRG